MSNSSDTRTVTRPATITMVDGPGITVTDGDGPRVRVEVGTQVLVGRSWPQVLDLVSQAIGRSAGN